MFPRPKLLLLTPKRRPQGTGTVVVVAEGESGTGRAAVYTASESIGASWPAAADRAVARQIDQMGEQGYGQG